MPPNDSVGVDALVLVLVDVDVEVDVDVDVLVDVIVDGFLGLVENRVLRP